MKHKTRLAFILEKDQFFRLSLNKILKKYGFEVEEIQDISEIERRRKDLQRGMIIADVEIDVLERWSSFLRKWGDHFVFMTPLIPDNHIADLRKLGVRHILKKPLEPEALRKVIAKIPFPDGKPAKASSRRGEGSYRKQKGGEAG